MRLKKFQFKEGFIKWVQTLFNAKGKVLNYGWMSKSFSIEQGVRQGCPLSSLLFVIVAEFLACKIRQNEGIKGIDLLGTVLSELKVSQFTDDTTILVNSSKSLNKVYERGQKF